MPLTLEVTTKSNVHFLILPSGNFSKHVDIPQKSLKSVMVSFQPGSQPTFSFRYPYVSLVSFEMNFQVINFFSVALFSNLSPVFDSPLSVPLETASNQIDVFIQPWLLLSNHSGINLQIFTADSLEDINHPDDSGPDLNDGGSFIPATGEVKGS